MLPGREGRAADHARDVLGDRLLVADPVLDRATAPSANACAVAAIAGSVCIAFVATIPKSQAGSSAASVVARSRPTTSPAPESRSPSRVDRVDVLAREVVRPDLDVVELREVRREQRPDRAAADDADPHARLRSRGSRSSRPPVSPEGRRISMSAISAPRTTSRVPGGQVDREPTWTPSSASLRNESRPLTSSAPTTAPQRLVDAADDEHRQREERQLEVDLLGRDRAEQVHEQAAGEAGRARRRA